MPAFMWCDTPTGLVLSKDLEALHVCFVEKILEKIFIGENSSNRPCSVLAPAPWDHKRGDLITSFHLYLRQEKHFFR
jgi:hypothetical protein